MKIKIIRSEDGGTLAELAIMVPFLVLMVAAVTEFGRFFQSYANLSKATRASARYLSNRKPPYSADDLNKAVNLVVCGKLTCVGGDELAKGMAADRVCIEQDTDTVKVSIPRVAKTCINGNNAARLPLEYSPIFDIGALVHSDFSLRLPVSPSTTMPHVNEFE